MDPNSEIVSASRRSVLRPVAAFIGSVALGLFAACGQPEAADAPASENDGPAAAANPALAIVNGTRITEIDVRIRKEVARRSPGGAVPRDDRAVLETIVQQEIFAQRAVELGLDSDEGYQERLAELNARVADFRRAELARLLERREIVEKAEVSDEELRSYFDEHVAEIGTEFHVQQILQRGREAADASHAALVAGTPFDEVAAGLFPTLPPGAGQPWDLGFLSWEQLPDAWRESIHDLEPGAISGVLEGPNGRCWIIKLIERRERAGVTFESVRAMLTQTLKGQRVEERRRAVVAELTEAARVSYPEVPAAVPANDTTGSNSAAAQPGSGSSRHPTPVDNGPGNAMPGNAMPGNAVPGNAIPGNAMPVHTGPANGELPADGEEP